MIENLEDRLLSINIALREAKLLQQEYSKLITFMISFPPMTEKHIASMEQELALARQQLLDLCSVSISLIPQEIIYLKTSTLFLCGFRKMFF